MAAESAEAWLAYEQALAEQESAAARENFAVYCGLQVPSLVEHDDEELTDERARELEALSEKEMAERYVPAAHHRKLCWALECIERGYMVAEHKTKLDEHVYQPGDHIPFKRLMIFAPPGSAKSTYASVLFPAWYMGKNPRHNIIQGSYNDQLATRFGRRARNVYASDTHRDVFGVSVSKTNKAAGSWETERGGEYFAFGINTGVTGRRAKGVVLDDIVKGRNEANSETVRDTTWETYIADVRTRMIPSAWIVYIGTRWHEDDPAGRILPAGWSGETGWVKAKDGEWWYVLSFVAIVETTQDKANDPLGRDIGEWLWPEWFPKGHFEQERATQGAYNWASLFKQRPQPLEGGIFKRKDFRLWPWDVKLPPLLYVVQSYDTAYTDKTMNDPTACIVFGVFKHPKYDYRCALILDAWDEHLEYPALRKRMKYDWTEAQYGDPGTARKADMVVIEKKGTGISLTQDQRADRIPVTEFDPGRDSKITRAHAASPFVEQGRVYLLESDKHPGQPVSWVNECLAQLLGFPNAAHDDYVDAFTQAIIRLRNFEAISAPNRTKSEIRDEDEAPPPEPYRNPYAQ